MQELWKPVPYQPFNEKYLVSNLGNVKPICKSIYSKSKGEFLKYGIGARGYACVTLYHTGKVRQCFVHRMVALAFIGDPPTGKNMVCHLDDNKVNNLHSNLSWGSATDNMRHMIEHHRSLVGATHPNALLDDDKVRSIRRLYSGGNITQMELASLYNIHQTVISRIILRKGWRHVE